MLTRYLIGVDDTDNSDTHGTGFHQQPGSGSLATVGLRAAGNDGRFLWLTGLRELSGIYTPDQLRRATPIDLIQTIAGVDAPSTDRNVVGEWVRPLLKRGHAVLLVEEAQHDEYEWRVIAKDVVKQLSD
jgi:hypothetical protein